MQPYFAEIQVYFQALLGGQVPLDWQEKKAGVEWEVTLTNSTAAREVPNIYRLKNAPEYVEAWLYKMGPGSSCK